MLLLRLFIKLVATMPKTGTPVATEQPSPSERMSGMARCCWPLLIVAGRSKAPRIDPPGSGAELTWWSSYHIEQKTLFVGSGAACTSLDVHPSGCNIQSTYGF